MQTGAAREIWSTWVTTTWVQAHAVLPVFLFRGKPRQEVVTAPPTNSQHRPGPDHNAYDAMHDANHLTMNVRACC